LDHISVFKCFVERSSTKECTSQPPSKSGNYFIALVYHSHTLKTQRSIYYIFVCITYMLRTVDFVHRAHSFFLSYIYMLIFSISNEIYNYKLNSTAEIMLFSTFVVDPECLTSPFSCLGIFGLGRHKVTLGISM
jgi:hypothetical protein